MTHYARWVETLGGSLGEVGWIMGSGALLGLVLRPWMAQWINRHGARLMWGAGLLLFAIASLGNLLLYAVGPAIFAIRSCLMLGSAIVFASGLTYISQSTPESQRTEAIGIFGVGGFLGIFCGPFIGDLFLQQRDRSNFELLFVVAAVANLIPLVGIFFLRPTDHESNGSPIRLGEFLAAIRRHWPGTIVAVNFVFGICMTGPFVFLASYVDEAGIQIPGVSEMGVFFMLYAACGIVARLASHRVLSRYGASQVLMAGIVLMSSGMFCFSLVSTSRPWLVLVPAILSGGGHGLMFHTMTSLTIKPFPREVRGTGSVLALMMLDGGMFVGAPVLGRLGEWYGFSILFTCIGACTLLAGLAYLPTMIHSSKA